MWNGARRSLGDSEIYSVWPQTCDSIGQESWDHVSGPRVTAPHIKRGDHVREPHISTPRYRHCTVSRVSRGTPGTHTWPTLGFDEVEVDSEKESWVGYQ